MAVGSQLNGYLAEVADALFTDAFGNLEDNAVLSDIAKITMGQSPAGTSYNEEGVGTVFYQGRGEFGWRYPTQRLFTTEPKRMAKSGDVLMSVRAPVGDLNLAYEDCCIGRGLVAISCDYPSYCLYLMRSLGKKFDAYNGEGTVFDSISGKALKGIGIGLMLRFPSRPSSSRWTRSPPSTAITATISRSSARVSRSFAPRAKTRKAGGATCCTSAKTRPASHSWPPASS